MKRLISLAVDGEISAADNKTLSAHTAQCDACDAQYREMVSLNELLQPAAPIEPSPQLLAGINRKLDKKGFMGWNFDFRRCLNPMSPCFMTVFFFIFAFYLGHVFGNHYQEKTTLDETEVVITLNETIDITIFDDMPDDSFPSRYGQLMQEENNK